MTMNLNATITWIKYIVLMIVLVMGAFLAYQPHLDNPLPLLADEYVHISLAEQILNEGALPFTNPYIATETPHANYESGFHFFLALIFIVLPGEPVLMYQYFAAVFFVINGLLLFYLVKVWSKKYVAALFAVFFFSTITSADGLLAHQYFVPLTLGITLLFASHIFLYKLLSTHEHRFLALLAGALLVTAITYPPTLFFFLFTAGAYLLLMKHDLNSYVHLTRRTFFILLATTTALLSGLFFGVLAYLQLLDEIIFHTSWSAPFDEYSLVFFFGIVPSTLAAIGLWGNVRKTGPGSLMILCWFFYSLLALYVFYLFEYSLLVPFPRLFLYFLIVVSILAGFGASTIIAAAQSQTGYIRKALLIIPLGIGISFHMTYVTQTSVQLPTIITTDKYQVLAQFAKQYPADGVMISDPLTSIAVYPITGNKVLNVLHSNIGGGNSTAVRAFMQAPCTEKPDRLYALQPLLQKQEVQQAPFFVASATALECDFLTLLPESNPSAQLYIYRLRAGTLGEFQRTINLAKVATPNIASSTRPAGTLHTSTELIDLIADNTLVGDTWAEYYQSDGTIIGRVNDDRYSGAWKIEDTFYCHYYPASGESLCVSIKQDSDQLEFYNTDGTYRSSATLLLGNPLNLESALTN